MKIEGSIYDSISGEPLDGVSIMIYDTQTKKYVPGGSTTNIDGDFSFESKELDKGNKVVEFTDIAYLTKQVQPHYANGYLVMDRKDSTLAEVAVVYKKIVKKAKDNRTGLIIAGLIVGCAVITYFTWKHYSKKRV